MTILQRFNDGARKAIVAANREAQERGRDSFKKPTDELANAAVDALRNWKSTHPDLKVVLNLGNASTQHAAHNT